MNKMLRFVTCVSILTGCSVMCPEIRIYSVCSRAENASTEVIENIQVIENNQREIYKALETYMQKKVTSLHTAIPEKLLAESNSSVFVIALIAVKDNKVLACIADVVERHESLDYMKAQISHKCIMTLVNEDKINAVKEAHGWCIKISGIIFSSLEINPELVNKGVALCYAQWKGYQDIRSRDEFNKYRLHNA
jgi:hypothetical protein